MMINQIKLSHGDFTAYLRGEASLEKRHQVEAVIAEDPAYEMLFSIAEEIKSQSEPDLFPAGIDTVPDNAALDELIHTLLSESPQGHSPGATRFFNLLLGSATAYTRIVHKFTSLAASFNPEEAPELSSGTIVMKPVDDVLAAIHLAAKSSPEPARTPARPVTRTSAPKWFETIISNLRQVFEPVPGYAFAAATIALLIMVMPLIDNFRGSNVPGAFTEISQSWATETPYDFTASGLRDPNSGEMPQPVQDVSYSLHAGMSYYLNRDYKAAASSMLQGEARVRQALQDLKGMHSSTVPTDSILKKNLTELLRDYYFYLGVSFLARSEDGADETPEELRSQAVRYLDTSLQITTMAGDETDGRENFFIGLARGLNNEATEAIDAFNHIPSGSPFYGRAAQLKNAMEL